MLFLHPLPPERRFPLDSTRFSLTTQLGVEPFAVPLQAIIAHLRAVPESRKAKGWRYPRPPLLALAVLAKLAGHPTPRAIAS